MAANYDSAVPESATSAQTGGKGAVRGPSRVLPVWPIAALVLGTPVWWLLGVGLFIWPLAAAVMAGYLLLDGEVRFPVAFGLWLAFVGWMLVSGLMLAGGAREDAAKFAGNAVLYLSATVLFLYAYRAAADPDARRRLLLTGAGFFAVVVAGGWFALAVPDFALTTPLERLLPGLRDANEFVARRVTADAAIAGAGGTRPRAPFGEVNEWGANFTLALPFAVAALLAARRRLPQLALAALIAISVVPAIESRNRGLWLALALAGVYALVRFGAPMAARLPARRIAAGSVAAIVVLAGLAAGPLGETVGERISSPGGTGESGRVASYREAVTLTAESPLLGHATTRETEASRLPAGTHGHGFRLLVSHGIPGLLLFAGWLLAVAWQTRRGPPTALCAHFVILLGLVSMGFYNLLPGQLHLIMLAAALGLAAVAAGESRSSGTSGNDVLVRDRPRS